MLKDTEQENGIPCGRRERSDTVFLHLCAEKRRKNMGRGEIKKESKGRPSSKNTKEKPIQQPAYIAPEMVKKKKKEDW